MKIIISESIACQETAWVLAQYKDSSYIWLNCDEDSALSRTILGDLADEFGPHSRNVANRHTSGITGTGTNPIHSYICPYLVDDGTRIFTTNRTHSHIGGIFVLRFDKMDESALNTIDIIQQYLKFKYPSVDIDDQTNAVEEESRCALSR